MDSLTGEIQGTAVPRLLQRLHAEKKTGTVVFAFGNTVKKIFFSDGEIVYGSSNLKEDWLGEGLVRTGVINRDQFDASSALVVTTGKKQGAILVELGLLSVKGLVDGVKYQVKQIIVSLFTWRSGYYIFDEGPLPAADIIPLQMSIGNLIIEGLRGLEWDIQRAALPPLNTILRPTADPSLLFQGAVLDQDHRKVLQLVDGAKSIEEISCQAGMDETTALKALSALLALGMAEPGEIKNHEEQKFVCEMISETVAAADEIKTGAPEDGHPLSAEAIEDAQGSLDLQNYYEVLGVARGSSADEIKKAYFALSMLYHPDQHFKSDMRHLKGKLETLSSAVKEAFETLIDQNKRSRYNVDLANGIKKRLDVEGVHTASLKTGTTAVARFNEGMRLFNEGEHWNAEDAFESAMQLDPDNAEYVFRRALNLSRVPRRGREAAEYFIRAIEMEPSNMEYYLAFGNFYVKFGLKDKALSVYRDALKRSPNSEKIKQAMKDLSG